MAFTGKNPRFEDVIFTDQGAAGSVANPASGSHKLVDRLGTFKVRNSAGVEVPLGGGSGEKNYCASPDNIGTAWAASGSGVTIADVTTAAVLPEESKGSGIKLTGVTGSDYARMRFTLDDCDKSKKLKIQFAVKSDAAYASGDFKVEVYTNTASDYSGSTTSLSVLNSTSIIKSDAGTVAQYTFDSTTADYYELRITRVSGTAFIVISGVVIGPGLLAQGPALSDWTAYTPTFDGLGTVGGIAVYYRRIGTTIEIQGYFQVGARTATSAAFSLPSGLTIDVSKTGGSGQQYLGHMTQEASSPSGAYTNGVGIVLFADSTNYQKVYLTYQANNTAPLFVKTGGTTVIGADNYFVSFKMSAPILEWATSGTLNVLQEDNINNWRSFTPTLSRASYSGVTKWRRVGDSMEIIGAITYSGTVGGSSSQSLLIPSGYTIDTAALTAGNSSPVGHATFLQSSNQYFGFVGVLDSTHVSFQLTYNISDSGGSRARIFLDSDGNNTDILSFTFRVPIVQFANGQSGLVGYSAANETASGLAPYGVFGHGESQCLALAQRSANPTDPTSTNEIKGYMKGSKLIFSYNDAGTVRFKYLDMSGTGVTWVHTTTPP